MATWFIVQTICDRQYVARLIFRDATMTAVACWRSDKWFGYWSASRCCRHGRQRGCTDVDRRRTVPPTAPSGALVGGRSPLALSWQLETPMTDATSGLTCSSFPAAAPAMTSPAAAAAAAWQMNAKVSCRRRHFLRCFIAFLTRTGCCIPTPRKNIVFLSFTLSVSA